jgi:hypothetical protein
MLCPLRQDPNPRKSAQSADKKLRVLHRPFLGCRGLLRRNQAKADVRRRRAKSADKKLPALQFTFQKSDSKF